MQGITIVNWSNFGLPCIIKKTVLITMISDLNRNDHVRRIVKIHDPQVRILFLQISENKKKFTSLEEIILKKLF